MLPLPGVPILNFAKRIWRLNGSIAKQRDVTTDTRNLVFREN